MILDTHENRVFEKKLTTQKLSGWSPFSVGSGRKEAIGPPANIYIISGQRKDQQWVKRSGSECVGVRFLWLKPSEKSDKKSSPLSWSRRKTLSIKWEIVFSFSTSQSNKCLEKYLSLFVDINHGRVEHSKPWGIHIQTTLDVISAVMCNITSSQNFLIKEKN